MMGGSPEPADLSPNAEVLLVRHGQTLGNLEARYVGWADDELTTEGIAQVERVAELLKQEGLTRVVTSRIARAQQSARILGSALNLELAIDERLNELRMGPWEGLTEQEVKVRHPADYAIWLTRPADLEVTGRETLSQLAQRMDAAIRDHSVSGERRLLVTHVAPIRVAILRARGWSLNRYKTIDVDNVATYRIRSAAGVVQMIKGNDLGK